jgi:hypothetical protein
MDALHLISPIGDLESERIEPAGFARMVLVGKALAGAEDGEVQASHQLTSSQENLKA